MCSGRSGSASSGLAIGDGRWPGSSRPAVAVQRGGFRLGQRLRLGDRHRMASRRPRCPGPRSPGRTRRSRSGCSPPRRWPLRSGRPSAAPPPTALIRPHLPLQALARSSCWPWPSASLFSPRPGPGVASSPAVFGPRIVFLHATQWPASPHRVIGPARQGRPRAVRTHDRGPTPLPAAASLPGNSWADRAQRAAADEKHMGQRFSRLAGSPGPTRSTCWAQTQGMIGYWIVQAVQNAVSGRRVACLVSRTLVNVDDLAFGHPSKFVGPVYDEQQASALAASRGWEFRQDGTRGCQVVPSPSRPSCWTCPPSGRCWRRARS